MEDQFANILQRNYGLKAVGKSASYGPRSDERISARALDRGQSVGSGLGRINQSAAAAAAVVAAGDSKGVYSQGHNGLSKSARQADPPGSGRDEGFRGCTKSTSVGGFDEIYIGARSGSASSSSLADFLEGSVGKSTAASSDSLNNEENPSVYSQSRSRATEQSSQSMNEQETRKEWVGRRSSLGGELRRSTEEVFLDSPRREGKMVGQAVSMPGSYESPRSHALKPTASAESESPVKGSFMRGFGRSRTARSSPQYSPRIGDLSGEGTNGLPGNMMKRDSNNKTTSAASSVSMDGSEAESVGRGDPTAGFTIPASNGTAFPDLNEPYAASSTDLPTKRPSQLKVSSSEVESGDTLRKSLDKCLETPKSPAEAENPSRSPLAPESGSHESSQNVSSKESIPMRRAFDLNSMGSPMVSPSNVHRSRKSTRADALSHPNGSASCFNEPLTKFEVNLPTAGASAGSQRARRKSDSLLDVWVTVEQIRLVTQPCTYPPPSRPPPPLPPLSHRYPGPGRHSSQKSEPWETSRDEVGQRSEASEAEKQRSSPNMQSSGTNKVHSNEKVPERSGKERANGGVQKQAEIQKTGYVLPEVTVVDLGLEEMKPSREEKRRMREQIERERRRAKREEERVKEKERLQREGLRESMLNDTLASGVREASQARVGRQEKVFDPRDSISNDTDTSGSRESSRPRGGRREKVFDPRDSIFNDTDTSGREASRPRDSRRDKVFDPRESISNDVDTSGWREASRVREGRREKVFDPRERHSQESARRDEKDIQYRGLRQQENEFQARLGRQEVARERENERSGDKLRRSAEKAALEAQERAERAAVERAVQEAHERAERAARQRAVAAREKERVREEERERERERDREEEKLRDRLREKERGLAEQLRSRDSFRATSEPRQRPSVSGDLPSGLSRFSSGGSLSNLSGSADTRISPSGRKAGDELTKLYSQGASGILEKFQEIPGEPADRRKLRLEKQMLIEQRAATALREKNMRDEAVQREQEERQRFASSLDADVRRWSTGKEGNLRALLSTLHIMLWPECNWKMVSMSDLVSGPSVKKAYQRAILCVHPDKVQQKGANVKQKYIAEKVFDLLKDAYAKFNSELY